MFAFQQKHSPLGRGVTLEDLGGAGLYLLSDLSAGVTGEIHFVDSGYNVISMPHPDALKAERRTKDGGGVTAVDKTAGLIARPLQFSPALTLRRLRRPVFARSKRSAFITLVHAATKSFTNFSFASAHA